MDSSIWKSILLVVVEALVGLAIFFIKKHYERKWAREDAAPAPPAGAPAAPLPSPALVVPGVADWHVRFVSHSTLFYWWPIWLLGFILAGLSYWDGGRIAVVPGGTRVEEAANGRYTLVLPPDAPAPASLQDAVKRSATGREAYPMHAGDYTSWYGPMFLTVLVMVIVVTNISFRGIWSFVLLLAMLSAAFALSALGGWDTLSEALKSLQIQISTAGYVFLSASLFAIWVITVFITDQQRYLIVTPTEIRMRTGFRPREVRFPTAGVVFDTAEDDMFLHWILGFFAGDLIVRTPDGAEFYFPNVMLVGQKLEQLRQLLGPDAVVAGK